MADSVPPLRTVEAPTPEFNWDRLLREIRREQVIPIIGPELLPYSRSLAAPLALKLGLPDGLGLPDVGAVADAFLRVNGDVRRAADALEGLLEGQPVVPPALQRLGPIEQVRLLVTTDYASLLEGALQGRNPPERFRTLAYAERQQPHDIDAYPRDERCVFHLLGHFDSHRPVALARVDQLEYFYDLQTERGPKGLLGVLGERRNLLFLGCDFPEWLAGFFTRILVGRPLYQTRERGLEVIASEFAHGNRGASSPLTAFLRANQMEVY